MQYTFTDLRRMPELRGIVPQDLHGWRRLGFIDSEQGTNHRFSYLPEEVEKIKRIWGYLRSGLRLQAAYKRTVEELGLPLCTYQNASATMKYRGATSRISNLKIFLPHLTETMCGVTFFNSYAMEIVQTRVNGLPKLTLTLYNSNGAVAELVAVPKPDGELFTISKTRGREGGEAMSRLLEALGDVDEISPRTYVRTTQETSHPNLMVSRVIHGNHRFGWKKYKPWNREERNKRILRTLPPRDLNITQNQN